MRYPLWTVLFSLMPAAVGMSKPLSTGAWLVDLGRDYPRTPQAGLSDADAEITLLYMQAAGRVAPELADAYLWQFDMLVALDRMDAAGDALATYVRLQPDNIAAHLNWIALELDRLQTAEARAEFCTTQLRKPRLPANVASDLHRRLAEFHLSRGERDQAIAEAKSALQAYELNFAARELLAEAQRPGGSSEPASGKPSTERQASRLSELLLALSACPNDPELARAAADELMASGLPAEAERLYAHAEAVLRLFDPHWSLAIALTDRAVALNAMGKQKEAAEQIQKADEQWQLLLARYKGELDSGLVGHMAWFYAFHESHPAQAEKLARIALAEDPELRVARRALGSALRQLDRPDEARQELQPIIDQDGAAAAEYAQTFSVEEGGKLVKEGLERATTQPADPTGQVALARAAEKLGVQQPASRAAPAEVVDAIERFPWPVLDYPLHPDKYLSLTMSMPQEEMPAGEPWLLSVRVKNIGEFPITFGPGMMVVPDLLVSVSTEGDRPRTTGPTLRFSFNRTPRLMPGESVEITHTIDLGVIRSGMIGTPQTAHEVTVAGVLSPMSFVDAQGQEVVAPDVGGVLGELKFRRAALVPTQDKMSELMTGLRSADATTRIQAMELLAMLLAEHQHLQAGRLEYSARPVDAAAVQAAILSMAADSDWQVRARLAECFRWFGLDKAATNAALGLLSDPHWLVRGLAMRALAEHHREKFQPVLTKAAQADPDVWVRRLADALNARLAATATPATLPAAEAK